MDAAVRWIRLHDAELAAAERDAALMRDGGIRPVIDTVAAEAHGVLRARRAFEIFLRDDVVRLHPPCLAHVELMRPAVRFIKDAALEADGLRSLAKLRCSGRIGAQEVIHAAHEVHLVPPDA